MSQFDLFSEEPERTPAPAQPLELLQSDASGYRERTLANARGAGLTVAFAVDFSTAGERLTKSAAQPRYCAIVLGSDIQSGAQQVLRSMHQHGASTLNIAGNSAHTLRHHAYSQDQVNRWVFSVLQRVHASRKLESIRSGGQTGADTAGLVSALALDVPAVGLYPKGYLRRNEQGRDFLTSLEDLRRELLQQALALAPGAAHLLALS